MAKRWTGLILATAFVGLAACSAYLAFTLLNVRCEGFSCTYVGVGWAFWLGACCLPAAALGHFAQRSPALPLVARRVLRMAWLAHLLLALGLVAWWLLRRS